VALDPPRREVVRQLKLGFYPADVAIGYPM